MKLEVGKSYLCRNGCIETLVADIWGSDWLMGCTGTMLYDPKDNKLGHLVFPITLEENDWDIMSEVTQ